MANNRMWFVYRPTGEAVFLGKRMGHGWYGTPDDLADRVTALFARVLEADQSYSQDDFAVALELGEGQPHALSKWVYGSEKSADDGVRKLLIDESVPYGEKEQW